MGSAVGTGTEVPLPGETSTEWQALSLVHFPTVPSRNGSLFPYQKTAVPLAPPACASTINTPGAWHRDPGNLGSQRPGLFRQWEGEALPNFPPVSLQAQAGSASHGLGNPRSIPRNLAETDDQQPSGPGGV